MIATTSRHQLRDYQQRAVENVIAVFNKRPILVSPTGCHAPGQGILMFDGTTRRVESVRVGDLVMGPDSSPRHVVRLFQGHDHMYRVTPVKGSPFIVNGAHVLTLVQTPDGKTAAGGQITDVSVREYLEWLRYRKQLHKLFRVGADFPAMPAGGIEPYFLGILLGDGSLTRMVGVSTNDIEVVREVYRQSVLWDLAVRVSVRSPTSVTYYLVAKKRTFNGNRGPAKHRLGQALADLGLYGANAEHKSIPHRYKVASRPDRLAILAGLLDTDGYLSGKGFDWISKSRALAEDTAFVARSLGLAAYVTTTVKGCQGGFQGQYFRVSISGDCSVIPCKVARRQATPRRQIKDVLRTGFTIEPVGIGEYFGFEVDADHRYLMDDFTVTHNSGKTTMATKIVERLGVPTLWLAHRKELIDQAAERLEAHGLKTGIVMSGYDGNPDAQVQVASIQTLVRRDKPPAGLIVVDEAHHAAADSYQNVLAEYPDAHVLGLTATPFRLDGRGLGDLFGELVVAAWPDELCDSGFLHKPRVWASKAPDLRGIRMVAGDYSLGALAHRSNTSELNADIVETWRKHAAGRRTVAFAVDIAHSRAITEAFCEVGVAAEHLDGNTSRTERGEILHRLRTGRTQVVSNCMVLTEGWDLPALECAVIARPTASLNLHLQMIGRVMRACEGKDGAIVLDHAGNHHVHGLVTRRLNYTLSDEKVGSDEPLGLRRCGNCGLLYDLDEECCPECGWVPAGGGERSRPTIHGPGELTEFDDTSFEYRRQMWVQIEAQRMASGYRPGWSFYRFKDRFGVEPVVADGDLIDPGNATYSQKRAYFKHLTSVAAAKGFKPGWASYRFRDFFGHWPRGFVQEVRQELSVAD